MASNLLDGLLAAAVVASVALWAGLLVWLFGRAWSLVQKHARWLTGAPTGAPSREVQRGVLEAYYGAPEPPQEPLDAPYVTQAQSRDSVLDWELQGINTKRIALGLAPLSAEDVEADRERQRAARQMERSRAGFLRRVRESREDIFLRRPNKPPAKPIKDSR